MRRIGVDVGGTFTDVVQVNDDGTVDVLKVPSTPSDPSNAAIEGINRIVGRTPAPHFVDQVLHGTTVATNMILEHRGCDVGMITTEGFRDLLHIARHKRPYNFSLYQGLPWQQHPLVRRRNRRTVPERIGAGGEVVLPLDEDAVRTQVRELKTQGVAAVAVCFLFSFSNPDHEERAAQIVAEEFPEAFLSVSSRLVSEYREFERFATACLNAYIGPSVSTYLSRFVTGIEDVASGLHIMTSSGGLTTGADAIARPVQLLMSGPVGGVIGGMWSGVRAGWDNVITLDVGGTSADIGLVEGGRLRMRPSTDSGVGGYQALIPMVDVGTIGTGGGSIAFVDEGGMFRVGPRSAGARPGPAAYGYGGTDPTVTDAMVNVGWFRDGSSLGTETTISREFALQAYQPLADRLGMSVIDASAGALQITLHSMAEAIDESSTRRGYDPREFALVAGGGAGPALAAYVAREAGISQVVIPEYPGLMSAMGLLVTDVVYEIGKTIYSAARPESLAVIEDAFAALTDQGVQMLRAAGVDDADMVIQRIADCRYEGQGYELRVEADSGPIDDGWLKTLTQSFADAHTREYSMAYDDRDVEIPTIHVRAIGLMPKVTGQPEREQRVAPPEPAPMSEPAYFITETGVHEFDTARLHRDSLRTGVDYPGPAIIEQYDSTVVVPPGFVARVHSGGLLVLIGA